MLVLECFLEDLVLVRRNAEEVIIGQGGGRVEGEGFVDEGEVEVLVGDFVEVVFAEGEVELAGGGGGDEEERGGGEVVRGGKGEFLFVLFRVVGEVGEFELVDGGG